MIGIRTILLALACGLASGNDPDPLIAVLLESPASGDRYQTSPFFETLKELARRAGVDEWEYVRYQGWGMTKLDSGEAVRSGEHVLVTTGTRNGIDRLSDGVAQVLLLDERGSMLGKLAFHPGGYGKFHVAPIPDGDGPSRLWAVRFEPLRDAMSRLVPPYYYVTEGGRTACHRLHVEGREGRLVAHDMAIFEVADGRLTLLYPRPEDAVPDRELPEGQL